MRIISGPSVEPISLALARKQCKVDAELVGSPPTLVHEDDELISLFITAAREYAENFTGLFIAQRTVEDSYDAFPGSNAAFSIDARPLRVVEGISYTDIDMIEQAVDPSFYVVRPPDGYGPTTVVLQNANVWPDAYVGTDTVRLRYQLGYSLPDESPSEVGVPAAVKVAMLLTIGHLYKNRESSTDRNLQMVPMGVKSFLNQIRVRLGIA